MQLKIKNGAVDLSGERILDGIDFEINDASRIAVVGRNGCGKTTLLKLISGEYSIVKKDSDADSFFSVSGKPRIGVLSQVTFDNEAVTLEEEIRKAYQPILDVQARMEQARLAMEADQSDEKIKQYTDLLDAYTLMGGFYFEKEYEAAIRHFGFSAEEKAKPVSDFSGGQRTKIAFLKLLLSKPDILLLDEPTNHLDIDAVTWLESYLKDYKKAFVVVSHDRMFLDNVAETVYEIEYGKIRRYSGNYTAFTQKKKMLKEQQAKDYAAQQKEIKHLEDLVERFRYKATKAAMAQSKIKQLERIDKIEAPEASDSRTFHADFEPEDYGVKDVLSVEELVIGYDRTLSTLSLELKRGDRVGIIGGNGLGKSTFIKTLVGQIAPLSGNFKIGPRVKIGYFDQQMALYHSDHTVLEDFQLAFPAQNDFEARSALAAFLFSGEDVFKPVNVLSGGERVRLALCKIFQTRPNFLILDEPTNHMDIVGKETLEDMLSDYGGTLLFVSHDRYFIRKVSDKILCFSPEGVNLYPYGYEQYTQLQSRSLQEETRQDRPSAKKNYTTPGKEKARRERELKKAEENIERLEKEINDLNTQLTSEENLSDYQKLSELQALLSEKETLLEDAMTHWEALAQS